MPDLSGTSVLKGPSIPKSELLPSYLLPQLLPHMMPSTSGGVAVLEARFVGVSDERSKPDVPSFNIEEKRRLRNPKSRRRLARFRPVPS